MVKLTNFSPPSEGILCEQPDVEAYIKRNNLGLGKLYVAESRLSWVGNENGKGFSLEYPAISVHGVSRDSINFPHECIYMMINCFIDEENDADSDEGDDPFTELHLVPQDKAALNPIFQAMSTCSALHPDESQATDSEFEDVEEDDEEEGDDDGDPEYYTSATGLANLSIQGQDNFARLENLFDGSGDNPTITSSNGVTRISVESSNGNSEEQSMETGQFDDADS